jgi:hypothetical protein
MTLSPEQKQAVANWIAAGDNLSAVQSKLAEQFKISLTYRDVRFLVDDLDLQIKDAAPKVDTTDVTKAPLPPKAPEATGEKKGFLDRAKEKLGLGRETDEEQSPGGQAPEQEEEVFEEEELPEAAASNVRIGVDNVTLIPGALASGTVTFSDGVTGKWIVDQYGRPGLTEISKPGYRPSAADAQAFMRELSAALQKRGF